MNDRTALRSGLSFLGERQLRVRVAAVTDLCRAVERRLQGREVLPAPPLFDETVTELDFLRAALEEARSRGVPPVLVPAFLQVLALPRLVQLNMPGHAFEWPAIPEAAYSGRTSRARDMLEAALLVEDAGWLDCQVVGLPRRARLDPLYSGYPLWYPGAFVGDGAVAFPLTWEERIFQPDVPVPLLEQWSFRVGMWGREPDRYRARGLQTRWSLQLSHSSVGLDPALGANAARAAVESSDRTVGVDLGARVSPQNPLRIGLGSGWSAAVQVTVFRSVLAARGAIAGGPPRSLTLYVVAPDAQKRGGTVGSLAGDVGYSPGSWGRPPRFQYRVTRGGGPAPGLHSAVVTGPFHHFFGPDGHRPARGGWDSIPLRMRRRDAALWCAIMWARVTPVDLRASLPLSTGERRPEPMRGRHFMDAFTVTEAVGTRLLLRECLVDATDHWVTHAPAEDREVNRLLVERAIARLRDDEIDDLFGRLATHLQAPRHAGALRAYLRRWVERNIEEIRQSRAELRLRRRARSLRFGEEIAAAPWDPAAGVEAGEQQKGPRSVGVGGGAQSARRGPRHRS